MDNGIIAIEYCDLDGEIKIEREYVTNGCDVEDILDGYEAIGCEVIRWYWW